MQGSALASDRQIRCSNLDNEGKKAETSNLSLPFDMFVIKLRIGDVKGG